MAIGVFPTMEFHNIVRLNPRWSTYTCFMEVLRKHDGISKRIIRRKFNELVDSDDYCQKDKNEILKFVLLFARPKNRSVGQI